MPLRNRVNPRGEIFATPERGAMMGNRGGAIHNAERQIVRPYVSRRWIACVLEFRGRKRKVMSPNRYTELFFLDEAVALAAGHRPCAECRRERFNAFRKAWDAAHPPGADEMDAALHAARIGPGKEKVVFEAPLKSLPDGCFAEFDGASHLLWKGTLWLYSPAGYSECRSIRRDRNVTVLTPSPIVECLRRGFVPQVHPSAISSTKPL
jgi:hypothetical protein